MNANENSYPVFEANQVLTNAHLNQAFDYLDEQERLTRANLIGIGIACGLHVKLDPAIPTVRISKGCGVTSEGYLVLLGEDVSLTTYRPYTLPDALPYPSFTKDPAKADADQYDMWELFPANEPDAVPLTNDFLVDKIVVLFVELMKDNLRNCSPNNCDDKGAAVTVTLRKLLMNRADADVIITATHNLELLSAVDDLTTDLSARLNLPDLALPRYNVPNTSPVSSQDVLRAFFDALNSTNSANSFKVAFSASYTAFAPVIRDLYPADPFNQFSTTFGFLSALPTPGAQVSFLQYYFDCFSDLIKAYDELRWKGIELMCACCPPAGLFPRHLFAGAVLPVQNAPFYRQEFIPASAIARCEHLKNEVRVLFQRLVEMVVQFTNDPPLQTKIQDNRIDNQIKITPTKTGDVALSARSIPYYYRVEGTPPLYQLWDPVKTARQRSKQNTGYNAYKYAPMDPTVRNPLLYDLEATGFLRIEGHLGKHYGGVVQTLQDLKKENRLPIEIIALRTGEFDKNIKVNLDKEDCYFQDLEVIYRNEREKLRCLVARALTLLYGIKHESASPVEKPIKSVFPLINEYYPDFEVQLNTLGRIYEDTYNDIPDEPLIRHGLAMARNPFFSFLWTVIEVIRYLHKVAESVPAELNDFDFDKFQALCSKLDHQYATLRTNRPPDDPDSQEHPNWGEIDKLLNNILNICRGRVLKAIVDEFARRVLEIKRKQFLNYFLQKNPGIQHRAGVPMGGTFIVVYHDIPEKVVVPDDADAGKKGLWAQFPAESLAKILGAYFNLTKNPYVAADPDFQKLGYEFFVDAEPPKKEPQPTSPLDKILNEAVNKLQPGTVIADFFLPYICCSDCAPIQFVINQEEPKPVGPKFTVTIGCTTETGNIITINTNETGYQVRTQDGDNFTDPPIPIELAPGTYSISLKNAAGVISLPQQVVIPAKLAHDTEYYSENQQTRTWRVHFAITGGTPPYSSANGTVAYNGGVYTFTSVGIDISVKGALVEIVDSANCAFSKAFEHTMLPCDGIAWRCAYRFWLPMSNLKSYRPETVLLENFSFTGADKKEVQVGDASNIFSSLDWTKATPTSIAQVLNKLNKVIAQLAGDSNFLKLSFEPDQTDLFGMLVVEYFNCLDFHIRINSTLRVGESREQLTANYDKRGAQFIWQRRQVSSHAMYPLLQCVEVHRGSGAPETPLFKESNLKLKIVPNVNGNIVNVSTADRGDGTVFVWESDEGTPAIIGGASVVITFLPPATEAQSQKRIRLIAMKDGMKYTEQVIVTISSTPPPTTGTIFTHLIQ